MVTTVHSRGIERIQKSASVGIQLKPDSPGDRSRENFQWKGQARPQKEFAAPKKQFEVSLCSFARTKKWSEATAKALRNRNDGAGLGTLCILNLIRPS